MSARVDGAAKNASKLQEGVGAGRNKRACTPTVDDERHEETEDESNEHAEVNHGSHVRRSKELDERLDVGVLRLPSTEADCVRTGLEPSLVDRVPSEAA